MQVREAGQRSCRAVRERVGGRGLEAGAQVGHGLRLGSMVAEAQDLLADGGLEAGEREVAARLAMERAGKAEAGGVARACGSLDAGAAGIAQAQHLGDLVEGLAQGVVVRRAELAVAADPFDGDELAVAAGDQEQEIGEGHGVGEAGGQRVRLQMVDGGEREMVDAGDGLAGEEAHDQAADQAGPGRGRDGREVGEAEAGLAHRTLDQAVELLDMRPCCYLGHHTAIGRMLLELRQQGGGQHRAVAADEGHGRLVAARLDAEDDAVAVDHQPPPRQRYPAQMGLRLPLRIGTRGSPLALAQATLVREALAALSPALAEPDAIVVEVIKTTGDRVTDRLLAEIGGKGLFTKEIEEALLDGTIDLAVHSMKDMPTWLPEGLVMAAMLPRADPRDALIADGVRSIAELAARGARGHGVAQACGPAPGRPARPAGDALARQRADPAAQAGRGRGRGHLPGGGGPGTPRARERDQRAALAGGRCCRPRPRVRSGSRCGRTISPCSNSWPASIIGATSIRVEAERAFLAALEGSCRTPIAALAELEGQEIRLRGLVARPDGSDLRRIERRGAVADAVALGGDTGAELLAGLPAGFLAA